MKCPYIVIFALAACLLFPFQSLYCPWFCSKIADVTWKHSLTNKKLSPSRMLDKHDRATIKLIEILASIDTTEKLQKQDFFNKQLDHIKAKISSGAYLADLKETSNNNNDTVLHWAVRNQFTDLVRYLLEIQSPNPNQVNLLNQTALSLATELNNPTLIELLSNHSTNHNTPKNVPEPLKRVSPSSLSQTEQIPLYDRTNQVEMFFAGILATCSITILTILYLLCHQETETSSIFLPL